jgi:hypothetical protein
MRFTLWIASLWPGSLPAWRLGQWRGLALAAAFGVALNFALITTFVLPEWLGRGMLPAVSAAANWLLVLGLWSIGLIWLWRDWPRISASAPRGNREQLDAQFQEAQHEYLKGHWIEAETLLTQLLGENPCDVEARLLLASVQRRTKRRDESRQTLNELKADGSAGRWLLEIEADLMRIDALDSESNPRLQDKRDNTGELSRAA